ncbi:MAG: hypothetical protein ACTS41_01850, partial [Candidatus Hodgkinia cicadicola]
MNEETRNKYERLFLVWNGIDNRIATCSSCWRRPSALSAWGSAIRLTSARLTLLRRSGRAEVDGSRFYKLRTVETENLETRSQVLNIKPEVAEACTSGLRLAIYVICSSNKRRNNYLRLRCSVTICQRSLWVRWLRPPRR